MGQSDLRLGSHGEGGTENRGIGIIGSAARGTLRPYGTHAPWPLEDAQGRLSGHLTHRSDGRSPQEKDGPELGAEFPSR